MPIIESAYSNEVSATPVGGFSEMFYINAGVLKNADLEGAGETTIVSAVTLYQFTHESTLDKLYYALSTTIKECDMDGSNQAVVYNHGVNVRAIDCKPGGDLIVYVDTSYNIWKLVPSTSTRTQLNNNASLDRTFNVWYCAENDTFYAISASFSAAVAGIYVMPIDTSAGSRVLATTTGSSFGMCTDTETNSKAYYGDTSNLYEADFDPDTDGFTNTGSIYNAGGVTVRGTMWDPTGEQVYWCEEIGDDIRRADEDGSNAEVVITDSDGYTSIRLV